MKQNLMIALAFGHDSKVNIMMFEMIFDTIEGDKYTLLRINLWD
jgi:hypothetical protein